MKIPPAFASIDEYNAFYKHVHGRTKKEQLIGEANDAIAWGHADNESTGYSAGQFISLIRELRNFIENNVP